MADWFKLHENWFVEPRLQWAIGQQQTVITVWLWCLTECCRIGSDTIGLHQEDYEMIGIQELLKISPGLFVSGLNLLEKIKYVEIDQTKKTIKIVKWTEFQSEYLSRKNRGDFQGKVPKRTKNPRLSDTIRKSPTEERRGEENRIEEKEEALKVVESWNQTSLTKCMSVTDKRMTSLKSRLKDPFFLKNWLVAVEKVKASNFCNGQNDRKWKADIDWFLRPDTCAKIMEGKYDNRGSKGNGSSPINAQEALRLAGGQL